MYDDDGFGGEDAPQPVRKPVGQNQQALFFGVIGIVIGFLLAGWVSLHFHSHPAHSRDLHQNHAGCQLCSLTNQVFPKTLFNTHQFAFSPAEARTAAYDRAESNFSSRLYRFHYSRAPPIA